MDDHEQRIRALETQVEVLLRMLPHRNNSAFDEAHAKFLCEVVLTFGEGSVFTTQELVTQANLPHRNTLKSTILSAFGTEDTLKLGRDLKKLVGQPQDQYMLERQNKDRAGALWSVTAVNRGV